ncbi:cyclase family protein [Tepidanaerobacter sp. EBM-38]|uniref:cyclase family protein n=1 Tax=Tepidanaerobacter sp. EBM-38 TaxID=1918496 RepID=UPI000B2FB841|nr:cyclase family protein [Tepidanaerobacter sp. EBM-38]
MKIVDLSQSYKVGMPLFPGTAPISIKQIAQIDEGGFRVTDFHAGVHVGTHCDAPAHCIKGAKTLDEIPLDTFVGYAVIVDAQVDCKKAIEADVLKGCDIKPGDIVLIRTGYSKYWGNPKYIEDSPYLSEELAQALVKLNIKALGIDFISPDPVESTTAPVHKILMGSGIPIIENLNRLDEIDVQRVFFSAAPLLIDKSDGGFTRAYAILEK